MLVSISIAANIIGVCTKTLRRWEEKGILIPNRTIGNHRRYDSEALYEFVKTHKYSPKSRQKTNIAAVYARVSSHKQKKDLARQKEFLRSVAEKDGYKTIIYHDIGSGMNDKRSGLLRLLKHGMKRKFDCIYLTYLDRLARFGTNSLIQILKLQGVEIKIIHTENIIDPAQLLVNDMIALVTSFAGKIHRMRKGKNCA